MMGKKTGSSSFRRRIPLSKHKECECCPACLRTGMSAIFVLIRDVLEGGETGEWVRPEHQEVFDMIVALRGRVVYDDKAN